LEAFEFGEAVGLNKNNRRDGGAHLAVLHRACLDKTRVRLKRKRVKERAEYELTNRHEDAGSKPWLASLEKWKAQYPQSDFADLRRQLYLASYRALTKPREAFDAGRKC